MDLRLGAHLVGIAWMIGGTACFALMHAAMKTMATHYPPVELAALRGLVSLPLVTAWLAWQRDFASVLRVRWPLQLLRGGFALLTITMAIYAIRVLPLSNAYSISFVAPLIVTAAAVPLLGERVDLKQWMAVLIGFAGVLIVLRPTGFDVLTLGGIAMLLSAIGYASQVLTLRVLTRTDRTLATVFWVTAIVSVGAGALAFPAWTPFASRHLPQLALVAITGVLGQFAATEAVRYAPASVIAPFEYAALIWAVLLDGSLWGRWPDALVLIGATPIIAGGIYLGYCERVRKAKPDQNDPPSATGRRTEVGH
jgi:drug/metabolite transporter (DMT)-like permease